MKEINGFWLPSRDFYFVDKPNYEIKDSNMAFNELSNFRTAIDVGAHCGYWTQRLSNKFNNVIAIEPVSEHVECLKKNTENLCNVNIIRAAASDGKDKTLKIEISEANSGQSKVSINNENESKEKEEVDVISIDELNCENVDFIKMDIEGHEEKALLGAKKTIEKFKPALLIEINDDYKRIESLLFSFGYKMIKKNNYNFLWKHKNSI